MSLTSYRAAPPRDKPLRALRKNRTRNEFGQRLRRRSIPSGGFLRRQPLAKAIKAALGCEGYVPTRTRFGKGRKRSFRGFIGAKRAIIGPNRPIRPLLVTLARNGAKAQP